MLEENLRFLQEQNQLCCTRPVDNPPAWLRSLVDPITHPVEENPRVVRAINI